VRTGILRNTPHPEKQKEYRMPLLQIVITLVVVGVLLWLINRFIPMQGTIKSILNVVVVICVVIWLLNIFGILSSLHGVHMAR
jgi:hypothetical protein